MSLARDSHSARSSTREKSSSKSTSAQSHLAKDRIARHAPSRERSKPASIVMAIRTHASLSPNQLTIGTVVFAQHTDRATCDISSNRPQRHCTFAMQPNNSLLPRTFADVASAYGGKWCPLPLKNPSPTIPPLLSTPPVYFRSLVLAAES